MIMWLGEFMLILREFFHSPLPSHWLLPSTVLNNFPKQLFWKLRMRLVERKRDFRRSPFLQPASSNWVLLGLFGIISCDKLNLVTQCHFPRFTRFPFHPPFIGRPKTNSPVFWGHLSSTSRRLKFMGWHFVKRRGTILIVESFRFSFCVCDSGGARHTFHYINCQRVSLCGGADGVCFATFCFFARELLGSCVVARGSLLSNVSDVRRYLIFFLL